MVNFSKMQCNEIVHESLSILYRTSGYRLLGNKPTVASRDLLYLKEHDGLYPKQRNITIKKDLHWSNLIDGINFLNFPLVAFSVSKPAKRERK